MQIRDAPQKGCHKIIEFYDVRAAEAAVRALNRSDPAVKKINLETSRLGGTRRYVKMSNHDVHSHISLPVISVTFGHPVFNHLTIPLLVE